MSSCPNAVALAQGSPQIQTHHRRGTCVGFSCLTWHLFLSLCPHSGSVLPPAGMKRPLSPSHSPESAVQLVEEASCPPSQPEQRMKREKKHQSFTLCEVCNIQLNSAAQAQIHYNGKSHQKRLKQLNKGKMPAAQGRSPPSRSRLPKGCPCSGTAAPLGSWKVQKCCILSLASVTCWSTRTAGLPPAVTASPPEVLGPKSPRCSGRGTDTRGSVHVQAWLLVLSLSLWVSS